MAKHLFLPLSCALVLLYVSDCLAQHRRGPGREHGRRDEQRRDDSSRDNRSSGAGGRKYYRFKTAHERLPKGIPDWFVEKDANKDGQVMMAEFATRWNKTLVEEFVQFDRNGDGVVTPKECLAAREAGAVYSGGTLSAKSAPPPTSDSGLATAVPDHSKPSQVGTPPPTVGHTAATAPTNTTAESEDDPPPTSQSPTSTTAESDQGPASTSQDVEIPESLMKYAIGYVSMYDTDGNGMLTSDEWEKMKKSPQSADRNGDGQVTPQEYALSKMKP